MVKTADFDGLNGFTCFQVIAGLAYVPPTRRTEV
jgi:hypothetical protein